MYPVLFRVGPITLHSYGLMLAIAFLVGAHLYGIELKRRGLDPELSGVVLTWAVVGGLLGARLYYLIEFWDEVKGDLWGAVVSPSGLVAYGGFAGGIILSMWAVKRRGAPVLEATDAVAPMLALSYAIGRIGCFLAGDGDYGAKSDLPWAMAFPNGVVPTTDRVHPTPLYEMIMMAAVFAVLWLLRTRPWRTGRLFALYLALQGLERFVAEFWRRNAEVALGLSGAQLIALGSGLAGLAWFAAARGRRVEPPAADLPPVSVSADAG